MHGWPIPPVSLNAWMAYTTSWSECMDDLYDQKSECMDGQYDQLVLMHGWPIRPVSLNALMAYTTSESECMDGRYSTISESEMHGCQIQCYQ